jgi:hypothetical protein
MAVVDGMITEVEARAGAADGEGDGSKNHLGAIAYTLRARRTIHDWYRDAGISLQTPVTALKYLYTLTCPHDTSFPMTEPSPQLFEKGDDVFACVERMNPALQQIMDQPFGSVQPLLCAMTMTYAQLLKERGGDGQSVLRTLDAFTTLPKPLRKQVRSCHAHIESMIGQLKQEGFALDAILLSMLGAILGIYQECPIPQD